MNLWGTIPAIVAAIVAIVAAIIAYNSYRLAQHYRDPIWVIDFDRQLTADQRQWLVQEGITYPLKLRLSNFGPDTAKNVSVRALWDPTDMRRVKQDWIFIEGAGSRSWLVETMPVPVNEIVYSDWDQMIDGDERRQTLRVEWKGPQLRRRRADVPLPKMGPRMGMDNKWWTLDETPESG